MKTYEHQCFTSEKRVPIFPWIQRGLICQKCIEARGALMVKRAKMSDYSMEVIDPI